MVTWGQGVKEKGRYWPKGTNFVIRWILVSLVTSCTAWSLFEIRYKSRYQVFSLHTHTHTQMVVVGGDQYISFIVVIILECIRYQNIYKPYNIYNIICQK